MSFNQCLPLAYQRPQLVSCEVHSLKSLCHVSFLSNYYQELLELQNYIHAHIEVCKHILPLHILCSQANLPISLVLISLKVSKANLEHSVFESFRSNLYITKHMQHH